MLKHSFFALFTIFFLTEAAFAQNDEIQKIDGSDISSMEIDKMVERLMDTANVTGLALSIFNNNEVVYQNSFGLSNSATEEKLTEKTIFYGASLSKAVFSVLVMQLVEEGK